MQASNGVSYYVTLKNTEGQTITPYVSITLEYANAEASTWADFLGLPFSDFLDPTYVTKLDRPPIRFSEYK